MKLKTAPCPACGGKVSFDTESYQFECTYCKQLLFAENQEGSITLTPIMRALNQTTSQVRDELLIQRYKEELHALKMERFVYQQGGWVGPIAGMFTTVGIMTISVLIDALFWPLMAIGMVTGIMVWGKIQSRRSADYAKIDKEIAHKQQRVKDLSTL